MPPWLLSSPLLLSEHARAVCATLAGSAQLAAQEAPSITHMLYAHVIPGAGVVVSLFNSKIVTDLTVPRTPPTHPSTQQSSPSRCAIRTRGMTCLPRAPILPHWDSAAI